jgi:dolichol-phosphate mannosyltransferase
MVAPLALGPVWVLVPTYNEHENLALIVPRIRQSLPDATILVIDDGSPDGTGDLADEMARMNARVRVLHRTAKEGLSRAYAAGFAQAIDGGAEVVIQMDADGSHDPAVLPRFLEAIAAGADLVLGSRYVRGGGAVDWPLLRRFVSLGGNLYARAVLWLPYRDLTGGFKAWRAELLKAVDPQTVVASGYVFQIELTWRAHRAGARIRELPITFAERRFGESKMSGSIFFEAAREVLRMRLARWRAPARWQSQTTA